MNQAGANGAEMKKRIGAYLIDGIIIGILWGIISMIIIFITGDMDDVHASLVLPEYAKVWIGARLVLMALPVITLIYGILGEGSNKRATFGKKKMGLMVLSVKGQKAGGIDIIVRNIVKVLPNLLLALMINMVVNSVASVLQLLIVLLTLFSKNHRGFHDKIADTMVVSAKDVEIQNVIPPLHITLPKPPVAYQVKTEKPVPKYMDVKTEKPMSPYQDVKTEKPMSPYQDTKTEKPVKPTIKYSLCGILGQHENKEYSLDMPLILGRRAEKCNIVFAGDTQGVSKVHCCISVENEKVIFKDMGSSFGSLVNDTVKVGPNEMYELKKGDTFKLGKNEVFEIK